MTVDSCQVLTEQIAEYFSMASIVFLFWKDSSGPL
jgi:hypothetical protein